MDLESPHNPDIRCGVAYFRPQWLQRFANPKAYLAVHCIISLFQAMIFSYMAGILSTIEKAFGLRSEYSAFVMSGNELSQILLILVIPCINQAQRRPLWVGIGKINICIILIHFNTFGFFRDGGVSCWKSLHQFCRSHFR